MILVALFFIASGTLQAQCFSMTVQRTESGNQICFDVTVNSIDPYLEKVTLSDIGSTRSCTSFPCNTTFCYDRRTYGNYSRNIECWSTTSMGCAQGDGCIVIIEGYVPQRNNSSTDDVSAP